MNSKRKVTDLIVAVTIVALFLGCTKEPIGPMQDTPKTQMHIDVSQNLKRVMHDMNNVLYERNKSELERDEQRQRYAFKLADTLMTISREIKKYPQESGLEKFKNPEKKGYFMSLADQLSVHGENIRSIASSYNMKALSEEIQNMTNTCNRCHEEFNPNGSRFH